MAALGELGCRNEVVGYLSCTDNMPSGTALKLGDVITIRGGTTVEVLNTDAEGRLVMADALVMAAEQRPDAIVDIATLTGATMRALGTPDRGRVRQRRGAARRGPRGRRADRRADLAVPARAPLPATARLGRRRHHEHGRRRTPAAITAALFLEEFVDGIPWAHIDIAGTAQTEIVESWRTRGCSGFGARLLAELALDFQRPA